jgi:hypothetical protein
MFSYVKPSDLPARSDTAAAGFLSFRETVGTRLADNSPLVYSVLS